MSPVTNLTVFWRTDTIFIAIESPCYLGNPVIIITYMVADNGLFHNIQRLKANVLPRW